MGAMEEYLACLNGELEAAGEDAPAEFKSLMVTRHNTAVTEMESVASAFKTQVQAYKAANPTQPPAAELKSSKLAALRLVRYRASSNGPLLSRRDS